jgi:hypothetical protein
MKDLPANGIGCHFSMLALIYGPTLVFLGLTVWVNVYHGVPFKLLSDDPTVVLGGHPLTGIQSNLGVLVWMIAAGICIFSQLLLRGAPGTGTLSFFFLWSGAITAVLALDDLFVVHEGLVRRYLGINEKIIFFSYGIVFAWYIVEFWKIILTSEYLLLVLAVLFLGISVLIDIDLQYRWRSPWSFFLEEGFKFLGIVSWSSYMARTSFRVIKTALMKGEVSKM